jgi:hypothetical protein
MRGLDERTDSLFSYVDLDRTVRNDKHAWLLQKIQRLSRRHSSTASRIASLAPPKGGERPAASNGGSGTPVRDLLLCANILFIAAIVPGPTFLRAASRELDEMTRRNREITGLANEQDFPHLVELALPPGGFRSVSLKIFPKD